MCDFEGDDEYEEDDDHDEKDSETWKLETDSVFNGRLFENELSKIFAECKGVNFTNALALNKLMLEKLTMMRDKLMNFLKSIKHQTVINERFLKCHKPNRRGVGIKGAYLKGGTFLLKGNMFFKDRHCRNCPNNCDYIQRSRVDGEMFPMDFELRGRHVWTLKDKHSILHGIKEQILVHLDESQGRLEKSKKNIKLYSRKLVDLLSMVDNEFEIDWQQVSMHNLAHRHSPYSCQAMWYVYLEPSLNHGKWTKEENEKLLNKARHFNFEDWMSIAKAVGNRSDYQCFVQFHTTVCFLLDSKGVKWTKAEDKRLLELLPVYTVNGVINWNAVACRFPSRTKNQCMSRFHYSIDPKLSRAPFTEEEDITLLAAVKEYGEHFSCIPRTLFPNRSTVQLRNRYRNTLLHRTSRAYWTTADDKKLMAFVLEHGQSNWSGCAQMLGNHTRTSCRTRFLTISKFLKKNPLASIEEIPRQATGRKSDQAITPDNWMDKIMQMQSGEPDQNQEQDQKADQKADQKRNQKRNQKGVQKRVQKRKQNRKQDQHQQRDQKQNRGQDISQDQNQKQVRDHDMDQVLVQKRDQDQDRKRDQDLDMDQELVQKREQDLDKKQRDQAQDMDQDLGQNCDQDQDQDQKRDQDRDEDKDQIQIQDQDEVQDKDEDKNQIYIQDEVQDQDEDKDQVQMQDQVQDQNEDKAKDQVQIQNEDQDVKMAEPPTEEAANFNIEGVELRKENPEEDSEWKADIKSEYLQKRSVAGLMKLGERGGAEPLRLVENPHLQKLRSIDKEMYDFFKHSYKPEYANEIFRKELISPKAATTVASTSRSAQLRAAFQSAKSRFAQKSANLRAAQQSANSRAAQQSANPRVAHQSLHSRVVYHGRRIHTSPRVRKGVMRKDLVAKAARAATSSSLRKALKRQKKNN